MEFTTNQVTVGSQTWTVEVADEPAEHHYGLMFREELKKGVGMLFVFEEENFHAFWMKNTLIPLDIVWISKDMNVVDIHRMEPCTTERCESYTPKARAKYVLEVNAGEFEGEIEDAATLKNSL